VVTVTLGLFSAAIAIDECARQLAADVALAMKRADLTQDFVSRCINVPRPKLSDQLAGKASFTTLWRFFVVREIRESEFLVELLDILGQRVDRALVQSDIARLVATVDALLGRQHAREARKRMAKASLPSRPTTRTVTLPLPTSPRPAQAFTAERITAPRLPARKAMAL
jgi:predicted XRE-type DNA-binding protein